MKIPSGMEWLLVDHPPIYIMLAFTVALIIVLLSAKYQWQAIPKWGVFLILSFLVLPTPLGVESQGYLYPWVIYVFDNWLYSLIFLYWPIAYLFLLQFAHKKLAREFATRLEG